ncbi:MAG: hypothetical protein ABSC91_09600 [Candidatus Bathyarchaeia archaeon]|jgi:hypothetical protein
MGEETVKKKVIGCLFLVLAVALSSMGASHYLTADPTSSTDIKSFALQFLGRVAGFNLSDCTVAFSTPAGPYRMPNSQVTPHFKTVLTGMIGNNYGKADVAFTFVDGNFWFYDLHMLYGSLSPSPSEESLNDSLSTLVSRVNECRSLFNASYWSDFAQLAVAALQTQLLSIKNENFSLEIENETTFLATCYAEIDGQYTSLSRSLQVYMSNTGVVTGLIDNMMVDHVATTNVTVSDDQAIAIADPYIETYAQQSGQQVTSINATFRYQTDIEEQRGDSFAVYPQWVVEASYDKPNAYNATGYGVIIWADSGEVSSKGPIDFFGSTSGKDPTNLLLLLLLTAITAFVVVSGAYLQRKRRRK